MLWHVNPFLGNAWNTRTERLNQFARGVFNVIRIYLLQGNGVINMHFWQQRDYVFRGVRQQSMEE
jgi:hypothetical protein